MTIRRIAILLAVKTIGLAGCTSQPAAPTPVSAAAAQAPPTGSVEPGPVMGGSAAADQPLFDATNEATIQHNPAASGADFAAALAGAGFAASTLQYTADTTSAGLTAASTQFSAQLGAACLIGQYGAGATGYRSIVAATLNGLCLVGGAAIGG
ncbi:DUF6993 domain-containing protein [Subtercola vilae]|uniref:DUF6993 domain-containing protein n=1 Tax=Subtercola vilae TaxID=2056433 RepID=UPI001F30F804|nr:hypothetical protein [Subtercola vilae]